MGLVRAILDGSSIDGLESLIESVFRANDRASIHGAILAAASKPNSWR